MDMNGYLFIRRKHGTRLKRFSPRSTPQSMEKSRSTFRETQTPTAISYPTKKSTLVVRFSYGGRTVLLLCEREDSNRFRKTERIQAIRCGPEGHENSIGSAENHLFVG